MSTSLTVLTLPGPAPRVFDVYWATGPRVQGIVRVRIDCDTGDDAVAAELSALQRLLEEREVCGQDRAGKSMSITVSLGAVRKLALGRSEKASLAPFALFLRTRFSEATLQVSKDQSFISFPKARNHVEEISVSAPLVSTVAFPDGFRAIVSEHALAAYMQRYVTYSPSDAWRYLRYAARNPLTREDSISREEAQRYPSLLKAYVTPCGLRLIVVDHPAGPRIATLYYSRRAVRHALPA